MSDDGEVHGLSAAIGGLQTAVLNLATAVNEGRAEIRELSGDVRSLQHTVTEMKPEVETLRKEREQREGAALWRGRVMKAAILLGTSLGSAGTAVSALRWLWAKG